MQTIETIIQIAMALIGAYVAAPYAEVRFAHVNHWVQQEAPTEVSNALISFLQAE